MIIVFLWDECSPSLWVFAQRSYTCNYFSSFRMSETAHGVTIAIVNRGRWLHISIHDSFSWSWEYWFLRPSAHSLSHTLLHQAMQCQALTLLQNNSRHSLTVTQWRYQGIREAQWGRAVMWGAWKRGCMINPYLVLPTTWGSHICGKCVYSK